MLIFKFVLFTYDRIMYAGPLRMHPISNRACLSVQHTSIGARCLPVLANSRRGGLAPNTAQRSRNRQCRRSHAKQLEARTVYRPGELLEVTPGLIVSQHSGE